MARGIFLLVGFCFALGGAVPGCGGESRRHGAPRPAATDGSEMPGAGAPSGGDTTMRDGGTTAPDGGMAPPDGGPTMEVLVDGAEEPVDGRAGFIWVYGIGNWFVSSVEDGTDDARLELLDPPRGTSTRACHVTGSGHARGVDLWAQLNHPAGNPIDLSVYAGFTFWARLTSKSGVLRVGVNQFEGFVPGNAEPATKTKLLDATADWASYTVTFAELGADSTMLRSFDFIAGDGGEAFELWVDDLGLVCEGACPTFD